MILSGVSQNDVSFGKKTATQAKHARRAKRGKQAKQAKSGKQGQKGKQAWQAKQAQQAPGAVIKNPSIGNLGESRAYQGRAPTDLVLYE